MSLGNQIAVIEMVKKREKSYFLIEFKRLKLCIKKNNIIYNEKINVKRFCKSLTLIVST